MKSKFKKLMAAALVLCLVLALLPAAAFADNEGSQSPGGGSGSLGGDTCTITYLNANGTPKPGWIYDYGTVTVVPKNSNDEGAPSEFEEGTEVVITATPKQGCGIFEFTVGDLAVEITDPTQHYSTEYTITQDTTITAGFNTVYNITIPTFEHGSITADKVAFAGDRVTLNVLPDRGYAVKGLTFYNADTDEVANIELDGSNTFTMPEYNVRISAYFEPAPVMTYYSVECQVYGGHGNVSAAFPQYIQGNTVELSINPDTGYVLDQLYYVDKGGFYDPQPITNTSFEMPGYNVIVVATFEKVADTYTIGTNVTGQGTVTISPVSPVAEDTMVTVTATPAEGYKLELLNYSFDGHTWAPVEITSGVAFPMPAHNITVNAVFVPVSGEYAINVKTDGGCTVISEKTAAYGEYVTIDIDMNAGHHLYNVYLDNELVTDDVYWYNGQWHYSFYMPRHDVDIYVTTTTKYFVNPVYNIDGGAVEVWVKDASGWDSTIFADKGDWVCFKVSPYSGYELGSVSVIGRWSNQSYDVHYNNYDGCYYFKMPGESVDLSVSFVDGQHRVYVKDVSNGSLTANVNWAAEGDKVYVTAKPSKGYELTWLSVKAADGTVLKIYEALGENTYYFYMPDQYVTVSGIFSLISSGLPFVDVNSGAWYYDAVSFVYNKGIMNGVTSTTFEPNSTITRGMVVTMLWRMAGEPYVSGGSFSDVASGRYYSTAVAWAAKNGIVDGYSSTVFGVNDPVTREQFATILYRYAKYMGYSTTGSSLTGYYDANSVSSWARDAMGWAVRNGIITGSGNSRLNPTGTASRAEVAQMFMSFYEFTT